MLIGMSLLPKPDIILFWSFLAILFSSCTKPSETPYIRASHLSNAILNNDAQAISYIQKCNPSINKLKKIKQQVNHNYITRSQVQVTDSTGTWTLGIDTTAVSPNDSNVILAIYLHGGVSSPRNNKGEKAYEMLQFLNEGNSNPILVVSPSGSRSAPWWSNSGIKRIMYSYRYVALHYNINPQKVFLAGVSDGGTGVFAVANKEVHPFAGFISISGYGGMLPQLGVSLSLSHLQKHPIYVINAGKDRLYPLRYVKDFCYYLQKNGVPITTCFYPDEEHGFTYKLKEKDAILSFINSTINTSADNYLYSNILRKIP